MTQPLTGRRFILEFAMLDDTSLRGLVETCGYERPDKKSPFASKDMILKNGAGFKVSIMRDPDHQRALITFDGDLTNWSNVLVALNNVYHDLACVGLIEPLDIS